jgi:hypothetical protein
MANLVNSWVRYVDRSYQQIKQAMLDRLPIKNPELTDFTETNPLIILVDFFAGLMEHINYYIDQMAREAFLGSARRYVSVIKLVRLLDYRVKARSPESVAIQYTPYKNGQPTAFATPYAIGIGSTFTNNGVTWIVTKADPASTSGGVVGVKQMTLVNDETLGISNGTANQQFSLGTNYAHESLVLFVGDDPWNLKTTLGASDGVDEDYQIDIGEDRIARVTFGDDTQGKIPPLGTEIIGSWSTTLGPDGRVQKNTTSWVLTNNTADNSSVDMTGYSFVYSNPNDSSGGAYYETIEQIRANAPRSIRTLDRAVTYQDYIDIVSIFPGVAQAAVKFCCGKQFDVYIAPVGGYGAIASPSLIADVQAWLDERKMITTKPLVREAFSSLIFLKVTVMPKFRRNPSAVEADVRAALLDYGSWENQKINGAIRLSDITALIDNLKTVEYVDITQLSIEPFARPTPGSIDLEWTRNLNSGSKTTVNWRLTFDGINFNLYRNEVFQSTIPMGTEYTDPDNIITFTIPLPDPMLYVLGMTWTFTTLALLDNVVISDYTLPYLTNDSITVTVLPRPTLTPIPDKTCSLQ